MTANGDGTAENPSSADFWGRRAWEHLKITIMHTDIQLVYSCALGASCRFANRERMLSLTWLLALSVIVLTL